MEQIQQIKHQYFKIKAKLQGEYTKFEDVSKAVKENALRFILASDFREILDTKPLSLEEFKVTSFNDRLPGKESAKVNNEVSKLLNKISIPLSTRFCGRFIPNGSSADGTKVIEADEFDYLYEIGIYNPVELTNIRDGLTCDVTHNGRPLSAAEIFQLFSDKICDIVNELLASDLDQVGHGGFANPHFSGIRINAPAVTLLFTCQDLHTLTHLLSVDLAVGIRIPDHERNRVLAEQNNVNRHLLKCIQRDNPLFIMANDLHLVAANTAGVVNWNVTTSCLESDVLRGLPAECPFKQAIRITKILRHDVLDQMWSYKWDGKPLGYPFRDLNAVEEVNWLINVTPGAKRFKIISESMAYAHILQPYDDAVRRYEIPTREVTLNSFAIKQLAFKQACETTGAFGYESSDAIVHKLVLAIWKTLSDEELFQIPHSFLSCKVRILSISSIAADHWIYLNLIIKEQCKQVYRKLSGQLLDLHQVELQQTLPTNAELRSVSPGDTAQQSIQFIYKLKARLIHLLDQLQRKEPDNPVWADAKDQLQGDNRKQMPDFCIRGYNNVTVSANTKTTMPPSVLLTMNPVGRHLAPLYDNVQQKPLAQKLTEHLRDFREKTDQVLSKTYEDEELSDVDNKDMHEDSVTLLGRRLLTSMFREPSLLWDVEAPVYNIAILLGGNIIGACVGGFQVYDKKRGQKIKHPLSAMIKGDVRGVSVGDDGATAAAVEYIGHEHGCLHICTSVNGRWKRQKFNTCKKPLAVACTADGHFVVSNYNNSIHKYNKHGQQIWKKKISFCPEYINTDHKNRIMVSNTKGGCVTVYNEDGVEMFSFPAATDQRKLKPHGLCVDDEDNILVGDDDSKSVLIYDPSGQFLKKLVDINGYSQSLALYRDTHLAVCSGWSMRLYTL